ncbi:lipopolysaccharide biosynthesis protein [Egibacter rhizosphaerae]|uniref:lipopolysaccharide biosynthesis protein n=1 Tax=Egibacter rhizosphaerae TaxID=1670831 RepID=UPI001F118966|nr:lipopolysaccharide biosynthesis protein [Egibacter rhizosphaerae]
MRGVAATAGGQWLRFILHIATTMVLARLVTPEDYGLVTMVVAITGLAERLLTVGLRTATIQRREITDQQVSALFWITVILGTIVSALFAGSAELISAFYGEPELVPVTLAMSSIFVLTAFGSQHIALLDRHMRFKLLAVMEVTALGVAGVAAIVVGALGMGYWAIVVLHLAQPAVKLAFGWLGTGWKPQLPRAWAGVRSLLSFGAYQTLFQVLTYSSQNLDNVVIGNAIGSSALGIYSRAYQLLLVPIRELQSPLHRVAIPTLSRLQDQPERFRRFYRTGLSGTAHAAIPLILLLALASDEIILLALGDQWIEAGPIFRVLAFAGLATVAGHANGWLYVALGRVRRQALWGLVAHPLLIASFFIGLPWGIVGVATAYTVTRWLLLPVSLTLATSGTPVSLGDVGRAVWRPACIGAIAYIAAGQVREGVLLAPTVVTLAIAATSFLLAYAVMLAAWRPARAEFRSLLDVARQGLRRAGNG